MPYYSFKVRSKSELVLPKWTVVIGEGLDVFNLVIQDLPEFLTALKERGVEVLEVNQLDNFSPIPVEPAEPQLQNQAEVPLLPNRT